MGQEVRFLDTPTEDGEMERRGVQRGRGSRGLWRGGRPAPLLLGAGLAGALAGFWSPLPVAGQERAPEELREFALERLAWMRGGGRLGVTLDAAQEASVDALGARVEGLAPDGPASRAGLRKGDIITALDGVSLLEPFQRQSREARLRRGESLPVQRLQLLTRELDPGDSVRVSYLREGAAGEVTVVAEALGPARVFFRGPGGEGIRRGPVPPGTEGLEALGRFRESLTGALGSSVAGVELVTVNPELGEYFNSSDGALVVHLPEGSSLGLLPGDVILAIGDRTVEDASHARRILASYRPGEEITFRVMRRQREETVLGVRD